MATLNATSANSAAPRRRQGGYVLFVSLIALLVLYLGFLYFIHGTLSDAQLAGNAVQRSKNLQASDLALRAVTQQINQVAAGGQMLEIAATSQPWWRSVNPGTTLPDATYWSQCAQSTDPTARCEQVAAPTGGSLPGTYANQYQSLAVVQPTGRFDSYSCQIPQYTAVYYDIVIHTAEANGRTSADIETVYKLCVPSGS